VNTILVERDLLESLKDKEFREAFNLENVYASICFQLRALREQRELSQAELGRAAGMAQERISILEDPNAETKPTLNTLIRLSDGLDVGLEVRFVPFSVVLNRSVHTNMRDLEVSSFPDEVPLMESRIRDEMHSYGGNVSAPPARHSRSGNVFSGDVFKQVQQEEQIRKALSGDSKQGVPNIRIQPSVNAPFPPSGAMEGLSGSHISPAS
jgi:transcriptional regulator with XRE-family HTH domain